MVFKISNDAPLSFFLKIFFGIVFKPFGISFHIMVHMGFFNFIQGPLRDLIKNSRSSFFAGTHIIVCPTVIYYTVMPTNQ